MLSYLAVDSLLVIHRQMSTSQTQDEGNFAGRSSVSTELKEREVSCSDP